MSNKYSEIRDSDKIALIEKVRRQDYGKYLKKMSLQKVRAFEGVDVIFEFPVTAIIGPNGGGKSTIIGSAACAYKSIRPGMFFPKSAIGDDSMSGWSIEYELVDKGINSEQLVRRSSKFRQLKWVRADVLDRNYLYFGIERTVPAGEKSKFNKLKRSTYQHSGSLLAINKDVARQIEHILGKSVEAFKVTTIGTADKFFIGGDGNIEYSEFHFGAGESSIIRMVSEIENAPNNVFVLIEEIENGLHPVATRRMVEYLIDVAKRKGIQTVFTTHSDFALSPLPNEAVWAAIDGHISQGKLSIETLRAISGRVEKELAIFVEDSFAKAWLDTILRVGLKQDFSRVEVYPVSGDGNAVKTHKMHRENPSIEFDSLCFLDGDSRQEKDEELGIFRLPGKQPELTVFEDIYDNFDTNIAKLTVACHLDATDQTNVKKIATRVAHTNRDPHLLFNQLGMEIGFIPEEIVCGAFLSLWVQQNMEYVGQLSRAVRGCLSDERS